MPTPRPTILIVEDEAALAQMLLLQLRHGGFEPECVSNGAAADAVLRQRLPDAVLLDWMLPGGESGLALARRWRAKERTRDVPILMLTARAAEGDRIDGLESGADDYIVKPFSPRELMARIRAVLRRRQTQAVDGVHAVDELRLDLARHQVSWQGQHLSMGPTEYKLLLVLMEAGGRVLSRTQLQERVWGHSAEVEERTVDVHIKRLRAALAGAAHLVQTVRGMGYRLAAQGRAEVLESRGDRP